MNARLGSLLLLVAVEVVAGPAVIDDTGRPVRMEKPARRIVTLAPHATELVLALKSAHRLVAAMEAPGLPEEIPRLAVPGPVDRERLLALQPDLVIAWASGNREADLRWLERMNIAVYRTEPRKLDQIAAALEKIALLAGVPDRGVEAAARFRRRLAQACLNRKGAPVLQVVYEIWPQPPMVLGGRHWLNEALHQARLNNVFADQPLAVVAVSREALLARPHDLVLAGGSEPAVASDTPRITVPPALERPGPALAEALARLCRKIPTRISAPSDRRKSRLEGN